jgi:hypothetical protein
VKKLSSPLGKGAELFIFIGHGKSLLQGLRFILKS